VLERPALVVFVPSVVLTAVIGLALGALGAVAGGWLARYGAGGCGGTS
jgi:hypothetical protein